MVDRKRVMSVGLVVSKDNDGNMYVMDNRDTKVEIKVITHLVVTVEMGIPRIKYIEGGRLKMSKNLSPFSPDRMED